MSYNTSLDYKKTIYSGGVKQKLKILFNNIEYTDIDNYLTKMTVKNRIIPVNSKMLFLDNFVSTEVELILRDIKMQDIKDNISISLGTFVNNSYEFIPIGIFNIQDKPILNNGEIVLTLRDNSVKLDFGYNAKDIITSNNGKATKLQIFNDICTKFGILTDIKTFRGASDLIGIYDNTITARNYISFLAEQSGYIPKIDRLGKLIFIDIKKLTTVEIPLNIIEKYEVGSKYKISGVDYESGVIKFVSGTKVSDTLYLDGANPYISNQAQVDEIYNLVNNFEIDSFKTGKVIGDPSIDSYDLIKIVDGNNIYSTFANNELVYNGICIQTFDTEISLEDRKSNVTISGEDTYKKNANSIIDNINNKISTIVSDVKGQQSQISTIEQDMGTITINIKDTNTTINNNYQETNKKINDCATTKDLEKTTKIYEEKISTVGKEIKIVDEKVINGVKKVVTDKGLTIDANGLTIDEKNSPTKFNADTEGMTVIDKTGSIEKETAFIGYDDGLKESIARVANLLVKLYAIIGENDQWRIEIGVRDGFGAGINFFSLGGK